MEGISMWYYLIPLLVIIYLGMAFVSGPIYVRATRDVLSEGSDTYCGYTVAAVFWPVCLPACAIFCAARATDGLWKKYMTFLESYYKKTHHGQVKAKSRDYY